MTKIVLGIAIGVINGVACGQDSGAVGRYQLINATVEVTSDKAVITDHVVFRIDTQTGKTWTYTNGQQKGRILEFWHEVPESLEGAMPKTK